MCMEKRNNFCTRNESLHFHAEGLRWGVATCVVWGSENSATAALREVKPRKANLELSREIKFTGRDTIPT